MRPPPAHVGPTFQPIPHYEVAVRTLALCAMKGYGVADPVFYVSKDKRSFGLAVGLDVPTNKKNPPGMRTVMGMSNSNTGHAGTRFYFGLGPEGKTQESLVLGQIRKRVIKNADFDLIPCLDRSVEAMKVSAFKAPYILKELERKRLPDPMSMRLLYEAARKGMMPGSRVFRVDKIFFEEKNPAKRTSRFLYECFSRVCRRNPPQEQMRQQLRFLEILPQRQLVFQF